MNADWKGKPLANVLFQGRQLPPFAITLDVAANNEALEGLDEETATWFWRFTICVGTTRREKSDIVLRHVNVLSTKLRAEGESLVPEIAKRFPNSDARRILRDWTECLRIICEEAKKTDECEWSAE